MLSIPEKLDPSNKRHVCTPLRPDACLPLTDCDEWELHTDGSRYCVAKDGHNTNFYQGAEEWNERQGSFWKPAIEKHIADKEKKEKDREKKCPDGNCKGRQHHEKITHTTEADLKNKVNPDAEKIMTHKTYVPNQELTQDPPIPEHPSQEEESMRMKQKQGEVTLKPHSNVNDHRALKKKWFAKASRKLNKPSIKTEFLQATRGSTDGTEFLQMTDKAGSEYFTVSFPSSGAKLQVGGKTINMADKWEDGGLTKAYTMADFFGTPAHMMVASKGSKQALAVQIQDDLALQDVAGLGDVSDIEFVPTLKSGAAPCTMPDVLCPSPLLTVHAWQVQSSCWEMPKPVSWMASRISAEGEW